MAIRYDVLTCITEKSETYLSFIQSCKPIAPELNIYIYTCKHKNTTIQQRNTINSKYTLSLQSSIYSPTLSRAIYYVGLLCFYCGKRERMQGLLCLYDTNECATAITLVAIKSALDKKQNK